MPIVPQISRETQTVGIPARGFNASLSPSYGNVSQPDFSGEAAVAEGVNKLVADYKKRADITREIEMQTALTEWETKSFFDPEVGAYNLKGKAAMGLPETMDEDYKKFTGNLRNSLSREDQKVAFDQMVAQHRASWMGNVNKYVFGETAQYRKDTAEQNIKTNANRAALYFNDDAEFERSVENAVVTQKGYLATQGLDPDDPTNAAQLNAVRSKIYADGIRVAADRDPRRALAMFKKYQANLGDDYGQISKLMAPVERTVMAKDSVSKLWGQGPGTRMTERDIIEHTMFQIEGGDKIASEPNGNYARFGINSAAHPGTNLNELTAEGAYAIYKEKYWDKYKIGDLPPDMRFAAFQAIIQNEAEGQKWIEQANGDVNKLLDAQEKHYQKLVESNPEKWGKYANGWKKRLETVRTQYQSAQPDNAIVQQEATRLDAIMPGAGEELLDQHNAMVAKVEKLKDQEGKMLLDQVMPKLYAANGDTTVLSASEKARAIELGVYEKMTSYTGRTDPAVMNDLIRMSPEELIGVDLSTDKYRLALSQSDYESTLRKQTEIKNDPAARGQFRTSTQIMTDSWVAAGKDPKDAEFSVFVASVEDAVAAESKARGGKPLNNDELRRLTNRMLLTATSKAGSKWFDGEYTHRTQIYKIDPNMIDRYQVGDLSVDSAIVAMDAMTELGVKPNNLSSFIKTPSDYIKVPGYNRHEVDRVATLLLDRGIKPTPSNVVRAIKEEQRVALGTESN